eukprot:9286879-Pyramimonas_sp.AAC.1
MDIESSNFTCLELAVRLGRRLMACHEGNASSEGNLAMDQFLRKLSKAEKKVKLGVALQGQNGSARTITHQTAPMWPCGIHRLAGGGQITRGSGSTCVGCVTSVVSGARRCDIIVTPLAPWAPRV